MLAIRNLAKAFGEHRVLADVNLSVAPGEVVGLVGANGAGKSTLISIATGLLAADDGAVEVAGVDMRRNPRAAADRIGLAPQELGLYPTLTVAQNLRAFAGLHGVPRRQVETRIREVADLLELTSSWDRPAGELSGGQKRRLHTGLAVLHRPALLFLDEPTVGADVPSRNGILQIVRELAAGGTAVVYTTHYLTELERLDARIAVLDGGRVVVDAPCSEVVARWGRAAVRLTFEGEAPALPGWHRDGAVLGRTADGTAPGTLAAQAMVELGTRASGLRAVEVEQEGLERAYLVLTGHDLSASSDTSDPSTTSTSPEEHDRVAP